MKLLAPSLSWFKRRVLCDQPERWNHQYATGRWEYLKGPEERARLEACADLLRKHVPGGHVIEIGCGEALLQRCLAPDDYASWLGVDISEVAIAQARAAGNPRSGYFVCEMTAFHPCGPVDAIVFPESIYYVEKPAALLERYGTALAHDGVFIVSIFATKRSAAIWDQIHSVAHPVDSRVTTNSLGTWVCEVLRVP